MFARPPKCPSCSLPLALFSPTSASQHVDRCTAPVKSPRQPPPLCPICARDLSSLTPAARNAHTNRCIDQLPACPQDSTPQRIDPRVGHFLKSLGLERHIARFEQHEVDWTALRLLTDADLKALRLPEPARRRVAEALTRGHLMQGGHIEEQDEEVVVQTQQFRESKLALRKVVESSDDEYGREDINHVDQNEQQTNSHDSEREQVKGDLTNAKGVNSVGVNKENGKSADSKVNSVINLDMSEEDPNESDASSEEEPFGAVVAGGDTPPSKSGGGEKRKWESVVESKFLLESDDNREEEGSDNESADGDVESMGDIEKEAGAMSQMEMEMRLNRWKHVMMSRERKRFRIAMREERNRHRQYVRDIHDKCEEALNRVCGLEKSKQEEASTDAKAIEGMEKIETNGTRCNKSLLTRMKELETIDLTKSPIGDDDVPEQTDTNIITPVREKDSEKGHVGETIVLSSTRTARTARMDVGDQNALKQEADKEAGRKAFTYRSLFASSDEDEVMDLTQRQFGESDEDEVMDLTQRPEEEKDIGLKTVAGVENTMDTVDIVGFGAEKEAKGKKKRRKRVTKEEVISAIQEDISLYEDMLMMESVQFARIMESIKKRGLKVAKKALTELLQQEGVSFKPEDINNDKSRGKAVSYFRGLNCLSD